MYNIINAIIPKKAKTKEKSSVNVELFFSLFLDGMTGNETQYKIRNDLNAGGFSALMNEDHNSNFLFSMSENPNAKNPVTKDMENCLIKHFSIYLSITPFNTTKFQYLNQLSFAKDCVENEVERYASNPDVERIKVYFYLIGYNQGELIANIVNSIGIYDNDDEVRQILNKYFDFTFFLKSIKIAFKVVESIISIDPIGLIDGYNSDIVRLVTGRSDLLYDKDLSKKSDDNYPSEDKISIYDAVLMCEHTYKSQDAIDKSVFSIIHSWFSKEKRDASKDGEKVRIKVERDIYENVKSNLPSNINQDCNTTVLQDNWITTESEWRSVSEKNDSIIKDSNINVKSCLTGFYSKLYQKIEHNSIISYAYCTAGTDPWSFNDWFFANFLQGLTGISLQYTQSVRNAKKLDEYCEKHNKQLFFVGHSLGGGLASNNALATPYRHAITFNAAGLNPFRVMATLLINNPRDFFNITGRKNRIHPFIIDGEVVQILRFIGQSAMSADENREKRYMGNEEIASDIIADKLIKEESKELPKLKDMGTIEKHNVLNFLRLKKLSDLKLT